jgi:TetR/AcrR family transcriptional repressor of nem operon
MVGRPRQFDVDQTLDAAMRAFWARGYEATSMADLMAATGLHKGSLYQAFGDKHALFIQALKRYLGEMARAGASAIQTAPTPRDGLARLGHTLIEITGEDRDEPRGCMALNALAELAPHDAEVRELLQGQVAWIRRGITATVMRAQEQGQISRERSPELVADLLLMFVWGLATSMKGYIDKAQAHALLDEQLEAIF